MRGGELRLNRTTHCGGYQKRRVAPPTAVMSCLSPRRAKAGPAGGSGGRTGPQGGQEFRNWFISTLLDRRGEWQGCGGGEHTRNPKMRHYRPQNGGASGSRANFENRRIRNLREVRKSFRSTPLARETKKNWRSCRGRNRES